MCQILGPPLFVCTLTVIAGKHEARGPTIRHGCMNACDTKALRTEHIYWLMRQQPETPCMRRWSKARPPYVMVVPAAAIPEQSKHTIMRPPALCPTGFVFPVTLLNANFFPLPWNRLICFSSGWFILGSPPEYYSSLPEDTWNNRESDIEPDSTGGNEPKRNPIFQGSFSGKGGHACQRRRGRTVQVDIFVILIKEYIYRFRFRANKGCL